MNSEHKNGLLKHLWTDLILDTELPFWLDLNWIHLEHTALVHPLKHWVFLSFGLWDESILREDTDIHVHQVRFTFWVKHSYCVTFLWAGSISGEEVLMHQLSTHLLPPLYALKFTSHFSSRLGWTVCQPAWWFDEFCQYLFRLVAPILQVSW